MNTTKTMDEVRFSGRESIVFSASGSRTRHITLIKNPVVSHGREQDGMADYDKYNIFMVIIKRNKQISHKGNQANCVILF